MAVTFPESMPHLLGGLMAGGRYLSYRDVSERLKLPVATLRTLYYRAQKNRAAGITRAADMPEADEVIGGTPGWLPETIDAWRAQVRRPGRPPQNN